jgi:Methyltransferase TRM13
MILQIMWKCRPIFLLYMSFSHSFRFFSCAMASFLYISYLLLLLLLLLLLVPCVLAARTVAAVLPHVKVSYVPLPPTPSYCYIYNNSNNIDNNNNNNGRRHDDVLTTASDNVCPEENCTTGNISNSANDHHHAQKRHHHDKVDGDDPDDDWPFFGRLPPAARVFGTLEGQLSNRHRAQRKEDQLRCMLRCIFALLPSSSSSCLRTATSATATVDPNGREYHHHYHHHHQQQQVEQDQERTPRPFTIVDFGGGSGHLAIPLALLLQQRQQQQQKENDSFTTTTTSSTPARPQPPPSTLSYRVIVVDLGKWSLDLLHKKASHCGGGTNSCSAVDDNDGGDCGRSVQHVAVHVKDKDEDDFRRCRLQPCHGIPNLFTFFGPVEEFNDIPFDMGVALHLCGEATDVALRKCFNSNNTTANDDATTTAPPASLVFCPCCVGKLNAQRKNPYVWQATGTNMPTISYPQSKLFQQYISSTDDWNALAQAADYSSHTCSSSCNSNDNNTNNDDDTTTIPHESRTHSNAIRRTAKALVETDRLLFLQQQTTATKNTRTYETALTRMIPWEATPKNDIIMAWPTSTARKRGSEWNTTTTIARQSWMDATELECESDIQQTRNLLVGNDHSPSGSRAATENRHAYATANVNGANGIVVQDSIYWTAQEEIEIRNRLQAYFFNHHDDDHDDLHHHDQHERKILVFPTGMGRRKRKLVHHVAEILNLAHWCEGHKAADKTVAVAIRRRRPPTPLLPQQEQANTGCSTG